MHHPRAQNLNPARALADAAALAAAGGAGDVHLGAGFGEGEERGTEAHLGFRPVNFMGELLQHALQVAHGDPLVHHQALHLMEHRGMGRVHLIGAVHPTGADDTDGRVRPSIVRIWAADVWVRRSRFSPRYRRYPAYPGRDDASGYSEPQSSNARFPPPGRPPHRSPSTEKCRSADPARCSADEGCLPPSFSPAWSHRCVPPRDGALSARPPAPPPGP